jgi:hypothetical protein
MGQLRVNQEVCVFQNCFSHFVHPLYNCSTPNTISDRPTNTHTVKAECCNIQTFYPRLRTLATAGRPNMEVWQKTYMRILSIECMYKFSVKYKVFINEVQLKKIIKLQQQHVSAPLIQPSSG